MVSDSELIERLREFLSTSDLDTTTNAIVRRRLEEDFGIDLSDRKAFIREQVDSYMQSQFENLSEDEDEVNSEEEADEGAAEVEEEEEETEESSTATTAKSSTKKRPRKKEVKKNEEVKKRGGGGFAKLCTLSPELTKFTGVSQLGRTEVVKQLWCYIRENNLQDPSNRRNILCDDTLRNLFVVDSIDMFQMNKALTKHIWPLDSDCAPPAKSAPKEKQPKREKDEDNDEPKKKSRSGNSAFLAPLKLSDALVKFLGTGESELPRSNVVKRMWEYIKLHNLQDPADKRQILCDEKLKELFDVDTFHGFSMAKYLTAHLTKIEQCKVEST